MFGTRSGDNPIENAPLPPATAAEDYVLFDKTLKSLLVEEYNPLIEKYDYDTNTMDIEDFLWLQEMQHGLNEQAKNRLLIELNICKVALLELQTVTITPSTTDNASSTAATAEMKETPIDRDIVSVSSSSIPTEKKDFHIEREIASSSSTSIPAEKKSIPSTNVNTVKFVRLPQKFCKPHAAFKTFIQHTING